MGISGKELRAWLPVGVVLGILTPIILFLASKLPMLQLTFSTIELNIREKVTQNLISGEFAEWLKGYLGVSITLPGLIMGVISGILLVMLARFVLSFVPQLPKEKFTRLILVIFVALLAEMLILAGFGIPSFGAVLGFAIAAIVTAFLTRLVFQQIIKKPLPQ